MADGFFQRLGLRPGASDDEVREAYHESLARLVRKLRTARSNGADTTLLEAERDELREAFEVLTDPVRRRRYELMLSLEGTPFGKDPAAIQRTLQPALISPAVGAALDLVRDLSGLGKAPEAPRARPAPRKPAPTRAVSMLDAAERRERAAAVLEAPPEPQIPAAVPAIVVPAPSIAEPLPAPGPAIAGNLNSSELDFLAGNYGYDGRYLAALRQSKGVSVEQLAETTRISLRYLKAIEENAYDRLPAAVFVRGYLKEIVGVLEVPEEPFIRGYMALYAQERGS